MFLLNGAEILALPEGLLSEQALKLLVPHIRNLILKAYVPSNLLLDFRKTFLTIFLILLQELNSFTFFLFLYCNQDLKLLMAFFASNKVKKKYSILHLCSALLPPQLFTVKHLLFLPLHMVTVSCTIHFPGVYFSKTY